MLPNNNNNGNDAVHIHPTEHLSHKPTFRQATCYSKTQIHV